jgi:heterodisulfide reductase subunit C
VLSPFSFYRGLMRPDLEGKTDYGAPPLRALQAFIENGRADEGSPLTLTGRGDEDVDPVLDSGRFSVCFGCRNCTSVCPVVGNYEDPGERIGLLPHQIMACLGLGLVDTASRSRMLWDCATCYQCEEHCPQGVRITEVFFALKNRAAGKMIKGRTE